MKLIIKFYSFDKTKLNTVIEQFKSIFSKFNVNFSIISLPTKKKIWCLHQSTFKGEDSKKHYERSTYKKNIILYNPEAINMNLISKFKVFSSVNIKILFK